MYKDSILVGDLTTIPLLSLNQFSLEESALANGCPFINARLILLHSRQSMSCSGDVFVNESNNIRNEE